MYYIWTEKSNTTVLPLCYVWIGWMALLDKREYTTINFRVDCSISFRPVCFPFATFAYKFNQRGSWCSCLQKWMLLFIRTFNIIQTYWKRKVISILLNQLRKLFLRPVFKLLIFAITYNTSIIQTNKWRWRYQSPTNERNSFDILSGIFGGPSSIKMVIQFKRVGGVAAR